MTAKAVAFVLVSLCAATVFGYWRYKANHVSRSVAQVVILRDASDSIPSGCDRIVNLAERALGMPEVGDGTTITMLSTGEESTANEPRLLGRFQVPQIRRVIEGQLLMERQRSALAY